MFKLHIAMGTSKSNEESITISTAEDTVVETASRFHINKQAHRVLDGLSSSKDIANISEEAIARLVSTILDIAEERIGVTFKEIRQTRCEICDYAFKFDVVVDGDGVMISVDAKRDTNIYCTVKIVQS